MGDYDNAQNFTIGGGSSAEGLVNNMIENLNGVHLNDSTEQGLPPRNVEKPIEIKTEISTPPGPTALKMASRLISSWMKKSSCGSSVEGFLNNMIENLNGVHLNDSSEQGSPPRNVEKPIEIKTEISTPTDPTALKMANGLISSWMKISSYEDGSSSHGVVQNITSSEKTNGIVVKRETSDEDYPNEYEKYSKGVNPDEYENIEEKKVMPDCTKFIGCEIYREYEGVISVGTVISYLTSLKLFEVMYNNDSRLEYLTYDEVWSHLAEKNKTYKIQVTKPKKNPLEVKKKVARQLAMEIDASEKEATSKRKMEESSISKGKRKMEESSISKGKRKMEESSISKGKRKMEESSISKGKRKMEESSISKGKSSRKKGKTSKEPKTKPRPWYAKRENATEEEPYEPYQFRGLYVCRKHNGIRSLATVIGYCPERNKLIIRYKTDDEGIEYLTQLETLRSMATREDIIVALASAGGSKKKNDNIGKASTSGTKKRNASGGRKV